MSLNINGGKGIKDFGLIMVLLGIFVSMNGVAAAPPNPVLIPPAGQVVVDGNSGEWNLTTDFFADMYKASNPNKEVLSKLYLRYDCENGILYALVLAKNGYTIDINHDDDQFIKLGNTITLVNAADNNDGNQPDFEYINDTNGETIGWEASAELDPGTYNNFNVHTQVDDGETSAVANRSIELYINCKPIEVPEFPMIAFPIAAILGIMFLLQVRNKKED